MNGSMIKKPHLIKNGIRIQCNTQNFVPVVVPGLSTSSSSSSRPATLMTPSRQESNHPTSSSSSSSSPTTQTSSNSETREREDRKENDPSPVPVSSFNVDDRTVTPVVCRESNADAGRASPEMPEWLQEFRENLVDDEIPLQGGSHASSSHEVSLEPTSKRREDLGEHRVYTHFLKDRNCEICQRTKITRARAEDAMAEPYLVQKIVVT